MRHLAALFIGLSIALLPALLPARAHADGVKWMQARSLSKTKWPECFCTDRYGKRRELGEIICLTVGDRSYEAKCIMAQNNPFWRDLNRGCMSSHSPQNMTPFSADQTRFAG